jgi:hypothetical protein
MKIPVIFNLDGPKIECLVFFFIILYLTKSNIYVILARSAENQIFVKSPMKSDVKPLETPNENTSLENLNGSKFERLFFFDKLA